MIVNYSIFDFQLYLRGTSLTSEKGFFFLFFFKLEFFLLIFFFLSFFFLAETLFGLISNNIKLIDVSDNLLSSTGLDAIGNALLMNTTLETLYIDYCFNVI